MQRLFSTFPGGSPGAGLLLLRAAVGVALVVQGGACLGAGRSPASAAGVVGLLAGASGVALLIGFLTPAAAVLAALLSLGIALSWLPTPVTDVFENAMATVLVVSIATALAFLGPGAFSLDARLFGRREVLIPRSSDPPREG